MALFLAADARKQAYNSFYDAIKRDRHARSGIRDRPSSGALACFLLILRPPASLRCAFAVTRSRVYSAFATYVHAAS